MIIPAGMVMIKEPAELAAPMRPAWLRLPVRWKLASETGMAMRDEPKALVVSAKNHRK